MTALPTDLLGEIIHYVDDIGTVNALARTCMAGATIVRELADFIADRLVGLQSPGGGMILPNGVKHGDVAFPLDFPGETFVATYCRGVIASWMLYVEDGAIIRGHPDTHYVLITSSNGARSDHYISVSTDARPYNQLRIVDPYRSQRQRLKGYIIDDVIVPSVIEQWASAAMNLTQPTRPFVVFCGTADQASALNELGIVDARELLE